jgi:DNA-binding beta-propeller fold protein YncE
MSKFIAFVGAAGLMAVSGGTALDAAPHGATLAVTMTNDPASNAIQVYDAATHALVQQISTGGKGGANGNARGIRQFQGELVAAVNNGSNSVAVFRRHHNELRFERLVTTTSAPVSIDFGTDHMYVAGATTVDSFVLHDHTVGWLDGTAPLVLASGATPPNGSTAQLAVVDGRSLLVTLKTDPDPGTVDIVALDHGAVAGTAPTAVSAPAGTLTPFGFSVYPDGTAVMTLAHSNQDGLFRNGAFTATIAAGQAAPCWMTRVGKYLFTANTGSRTISRLVGTGSHIFVDATVAAPVTAGGAPSDIDAAGGVLGVIDHGANQSHLSLFTYNAFGELLAAGTAITLGQPNANGIAIVPAADVR